MHYRALVGAVARGKAGIGTLTTPRYDKVQRKEKRQLLQDKVRAFVEKERFARAVGMIQQGAWTKWEQAMARKITWSDLWRSDPHRIWFLIQASYDVLPSTATVTCTTGA